MARRSDADFRIVVSVYGQSLLRLAAAAGVSQVQLAAYMGVTKQQTNHWSRGKEPIPPAKLVLVVKRLQEALAHELAARGGPSKPELAAILNDIFHENLQALGFPLYPSLQDLLAKLTAASATFGATTDPTPALHAELKTLGGAVNLLMGILNDCAELFGMLRCPALAFLTDAMEDAYADDRPQPRQGSGDDGDAPGAHPRPGREDAQILDVEES